MHFIILLCFKRCWNSMSTKPNLVRNSCVVPKAKVKRKRKTVHMEMLLDKPRISSLDEFTPNLPDDIRHHLSNQYGHLQSVLDAMKLPPKVTTCRVNLITSTKLQVIDEIKDRLSVWNQTTGNRIGENQCASPIFSVKSNKCFDDVIDIYHNVSATPVSTPYGMVYNNVLLFSISNYLRRFTNSFSTNWIIIFSFVYYSDQKRSTSRPV